METVPDYAKEAFRSIGDENPEDGIDAFVARWGSIDLDTCQQALAHGRNIYDRAAAIFMLGYASPERYQEVLEPYLSSPKLMERWPTALVLAAHHHEQALYTLTTLLVQGLLPEEGTDPQEENYWLYGGWRKESLTLLADWETPETKKALIAAFTSYHRMEQCAIDQQARLSTKAAWRRLEAFAMYVLGWQRHFEVLGQQITGTETEERCWRVYMALGSLRQHQLDYRVAMRGWSRQPELREQVIPTLRERFSLSEEEIAASLTAFEDRMDHFY